MKQPNVDIGPWHKPYHALIYKRGRIKPSHK